MNFVALLFFLIVVTVGAFTIQSADDDLDDMDYDEDNQGDSLIPPAIVLRSEQGEPQQTVQIPDQDGNFQPMTRIGVRECRNNATHYDAAKYVKCYLYSKNGTRTQFHFDQLSSIELAGFMRHLPTTILVHGWLGSSESVVIDPLAKALLEQEHNNVIAVDWEEGASTFIYPTARYRVPKVAAVVAKLIDNLVLGLDADVDWIGIIGHSLGAHIAGIAGKKVTAGKIGYIVGLDPASPLFRVKKPNHRLSAEDAQYVEIIHTNGKALGFFRNIGQADYYPNGGVAQPGCGISFTCSHQRAVDFFKESLSTRNNYASRCNDLDNLGPSCTRASSAAFGGLVWRASKPAGVYYITTSAKEPFLRDNSAGVTP